MAGVPAPTAIRMARVLETVEAAVYGLTALLALALLVVGTVALIAELKGTWHWAIHLESTVSYVGVFVSWLLSLILPGFVAVLVGRRVVGDA